MRRPGLSQVVSWRQGKRTKAMQGAQAVAWRRQGKRTKAMQGTQAVAWQYLASELRVVPLKTLAARMGSMITGCVDIGLRLMGRGIASA